ncbi:MAG: hypothetical protein PQJ59_07185 [Spirochaetales bacterium]|nr:hypothetical protein [Spirochaetales bacterium]
MPIRYVKTFLLTFLLLWPLAAQEEEDFPGETKKLEWESVEGALFYLVEIESEGIIIHAIKTEDSFLPLFLNPGEYNLRISVFNKFEKMASQSEWSPLTIYPSPQPIILDYSPDFFYDDRNKISLSIKGKNFDSACRFLLILGEEKIRGLEKNRQVEGEEITCTVEFSSEQFEHGQNWDLVVVNPSKRRFAREGAIRFLEFKKPIIYSMSPSLFYLGENPGKITIKGKDFTGQATLIFDGPSPVPYANLENYFGEELSFFLNTDEMEVGEYTLTVEAMGEFLSNKYSFTLEEKPLTKSEEIENKRESREGQAFFLGLDYHMSFPIGESSELFQDSFYGAGLTYRKKFKNSGAYRLVLIRQMGITANLTYNHYLDDFDEQLSMDQFIMDGGLFYLSELNSPFNIYLGIGFGGSYSFFTFSESDNKRSFDLTNKLEGGVHFPLKGLELELGIKILFTHFKYNSMVSGNPYFMVGRSW